MKVEQGARRRTSAFRLAGSAVLLAALAACGGGGGSGTEGVGVGIGGPAVSLGATDAQGGDGSGNAAAGQALRQVDLALNGTTAGDQGRAAVAALPGGGFVAVWSTNEGGASDVRVRRFGPDGEALGAEQVAAAHGHSPGVAAMPDGGFLVSWSASPAMYEANGHVQRFDALGAPAGGPVQVAASLFKYLARPLGLPDGGFLLAVDTTSGRYGPEHGLVTRHAADGTPVGTPVQLTSALTAQTGARDPNAAFGTTAAAWPDGRVAVAWIAAGAGVSELRLSRLDAQGGLQGTRALAAEEALQRPALAVLAGGQLALAWVAGTDSSSRTVWLEVFAADGSSFGRQAVAAGLDAQSVVPRLAALDTGGVALAWSATRYADSGVQRTVRTQGFAADGSEAGAAVQVASIAVPLDAMQFDMDSLDVVARPGGSWTVVHGDHTDAAGWDVRASVR